MPGNRAVMYEGPGRVEVHDIDYPTYELKDGPGVNKANIGRKARHGAILKTVATNICGSDQHMVRGRTTAPAGLVLGHGLNGGVPGQRLLPSGGVEGKAGVVLELGTRIDADEELFVVGHLPRSGQVHHRRRGRPLGARWNGERRGGKDGQEQVTSYRSHHGLLSSDGTAWDATSSRRARA